MYIVDYLINRFTACLISGNDFATKVKEVSDKIDCLQRAHAHHRADTQNFSRQVLEKINTSIWLNHIKVDNSGIYELSILHGQCKCCSHWIDESNRRMANSVSEEACPDALKRER